MHSNPTFDVTQERVRPTNGFGAEPIAIVGMAGRFPGARNVHEFWSRLCNAEDCIARFAADELRSEGVDPALIADPNYVPAAPVLQDIDKFDAAFFGITPREAELMDPQQRIFLECCWEALEDAGYDPKNCGDSVGLFAGARTDTYLLNILSHPELVNAVGMFHLGLGNDLAFLTTRVSHFLNLRGPSISVHTACSTSLVAVHLACESLEQRQCDAVLVGGVAVNVPHYVGYVYEDGSVQSPDGCCRTFDAAARGTVFGSGAGVVVLKRLEDALSSRDSIYAVIRGSAINNDGADKASFTAPSVQGQVNVIRDALRASKIHPDSIDYVECHGTGTLLGDAIEVRALIKAFGKGSPATCAIGSVKTNVGHLDAAAGMTGLIKVALSLKYRTIPASLHYQRPNPQISFEGTRFYVNTKTSPWKDLKGPRRAGLSAFGVGGTNAHIILEEAPPQLPLVDGEEFQLLPLSARSQAALKTASGNLADHLRENPHLSLSHIAFTLQEGRHPFATRRAIVARNHEDVIGALESALPEDVQQGLEQIAPPVTFLFPGQGAQHPGMGRELYEKELVFRSHIRDCSDILRPLLNRELEAVLYEPHSTDSGAGELDQTWLAQPTLVAVEYALARLWISWGIQPESMLGHSLGEYTAAVLSEVMSIEDALRLVVTRGRLMQETSPGSMLAISQSAADIASWLNGDLSVAALNAPDLCTVAGPHDAIRALEQELKAQGIACQPLRTSHAFHCPLVESAMGPFLAEVRKIKLSPPLIPFISCVSGTWIQPEEAQNPEYWTTQMRLPVQFDAAITELLRSDSRVLLDAGPGQTLRRLALRRARSQKGCHVFGAMPAAAATSERKTALSALAQLWELGMSVNWPAVRLGTSRRVGLPTYPFERNRYWIEPSTASIHSREDAKVSLLALQDRKDPDISQWFWLPSWRMAPSSLIKRPAQGAWMVRCNRSVLSEEVCLLLEAAGETVVRVWNGLEFHRDDDFAYVIDPRLHEHHELLWDSIQELDVDIGNLIDLTGIDASDFTQESSGDIQDTLDREQLDGYILSIQALIRRNDGRPYRSFLVSSHVVDVESIDRTNPARTGILALSRTLHDEYENFQCRVIDVGPPSDLPQLRRTARQIVEEARTESAADLVAYRGRKRWVRDFERAELRPYLDESHPRSKDGAYLILGGLGNVGLTVAEHLAQTEQAKLVLASRTALPSRVNWDEILEMDSTSVVAHRIRSVLYLEELGAQVETVATDIADFDLLSSVIENVTVRFGAIRGIIHTAGVTSGPSAFCPWPKLNAEAFDIQSRAKLHGLRSLASAVHAKDVPFVLLMSSNSSIVGGLGFAAYAAANCSMNAFAEGLSKQQERTRWISASWDHWPETRIAASSSDLSELYGDLTEADVMKALELKHRYAMTKEEAQTALSYILSLSHAGHIIVSSGNLKTRISITNVKPSDPNDRSPTDAETSGARIPRPGLKNVFVAPRNDLETTLAEIWEDFLGIDHVGVHDDFFELGGHSLLATKLVAEVRGRVGGEFPLAKLFEGPTVAQMAEAILVSTPTLAK